MKRLMILFAVAAAPELVAPSDWLPFVFGEEPAVQTVEEFNALLNTVMDEYNAINDGVFAGRPSLPAGCTFAALRWRSTLSSAGYWATDGLPGRCPPPRLQVGRNDPCPCGTG